MRTVVAVAIIPLLALSIHAASRPRCTLRLHSEANTQDGAPFSAEFVSPSSGKKVVIEKMAAISERDVIGFRFYPAKDGTFGALFQLDDLGRIALDSLSIERRGTTLFVFVNGRPLTELQIDRRVSDGRIFVERGLSQSDIELMKKTWPLLSRGKQKP